MNKTSIYLGQRSLLAQLMTKIRQDLRKGTTCSVNILIYCQNALYMEALRKSCKSLAVPCQALNVALGKWYDADLVVRQRSVVRAGRPSKVGGKMHNR